MSRRALALAGVAVAGAAVGLWLAQREPRPAPVSAAEKELLYGERRTVAPGRWRVRRTPPAADLTDVQRERMEELETIGYVGGVRPGPAGSGVTRHDPGRTAPGLNLVTSGHAPEAYLLDADGTMLHRWRRAFRDIWPDHPIDDGHVGTGYWRRAILCPNGDVVAIFSGLGVFRVNSRSELVWSNANHAHHDLVLRPDGTLLVLTREARIVPRIHPEEPIAEDFIVTLDAQGREIARVSVLEAFERSDARNIWYAAKFKAGDMFHTNSLFVLDGRAAARVPELSAGRVLTSMRHLDAIAVIDLAEARVVWARRGPFRRQHDPKILADGNLLLFNNDFPPRGSSVLELDPRTMDPVWEYRGTAEEPFYSETCGTADRLPNGNTLVTESDNGRAFEVTRDGEIVWEYVNPARAGEDGRYVATLPEVVRIPPDFPLDWLHGAGPDGGG